MTDRFTAEMHIRVPQGLKVFASGTKGGAKRVTLSNGKPGDQFDFNWDKPGFPGAVIAGRSKPGQGWRGQRQGLPDRVSHQASANEFAQERQEKGRVLHRNVRRTRNLSRQCVEVPDDTCRWRLGSGTRRDIGSQVATSPVSGCSPNDCPSMVGAK